MDIKGKKYVVTGGAGFIGSHLVDQLLAEDVGEIVILDTLVRGSRENIETALADDRVSLHHADIRSLDNISPFFDGSAGCFHLATLRITQCATEPRHALEVMIDGTYNVLEACVQYKVPKIIFSSSASVYGMADTFPTEEIHHPWNNDTWYGATKTCGEGMLKSFNAMYGLDYICLRYFNVYGTRMDVFGKYTEVLIRWLECFDNAKAPKIFGDGKQTMDFINAADAAQANILAMKADVANKAYNIATGEEVSLGELLEELSRAYPGDTLPPEYHEARSVNAVPRRLADVTAAKDDLGFNAQTNLSSGLKALIEWRNTLVE